MYKRSSLSSCSTSYNNVSSRHFVKLLFTNDETECKREKNRSANIENQRLVDCGSAYMRLSLVEYHACTQRDKRDACPGKRIKRDSILSLLLGSAAFARPSPVAHFASCHAHFIVVFFVSCCSFFYVPYQPYSITTASTTRSQFGVLSIYKHGKG